MVIATRMLLKLWTISKGNRKGPWSFEPGLVALDSARRLIRRSDQTSGDVGAECLPAPGSQRIESERRLRRLRRTCEACEVRVKRR
jgi:hypothetical protein